MVGAKVTACMVEKFPVGRMVDILHRRDLGIDLGRVALHVLDEFGFGAGRPRDQNDAGVSNRRCYTPKKVLIFEGAPASDDAGFVMQMPSRVVGPNGAGIGVCGTEIKDARFVMVNPHRCMIVRH